MTIPMKYIDAVLTVLEIGSERPHSREELDEQIQQRGIDSVHVYGAHGLFEKSTSDEKYRLNIDALNLLMTHRSIQQAKRHALIANCFAAAACVIAALSLLGVVFSNC
jgi:hypothetical protein